MRKEGTDFQFELRSTQPAFEVCGQDIQRIGNPGRRSPDNALTPPATAFIERQYERAGDDLGRGSQQQRKALGAHGTDENQCQMDVRGTREPALSRAMHDTGGFGQSRLHVRIRPERKEYPSPAGAQVVKSWRAASSAAIR